MPKPLLEDACVDLLYKNGLPCELANDEVAVAWKPPIVFACLFLVFMALKKGFSLCLLPMASAAFCEPPFSTMPLFEQAATAKFFCD